MLKYVRLYINGSVDPINPLGILDPTHSHMELNSLYAPQKFLVEIVNDRCSIEYPAIRRLYTADVQLG